MDPPSPRLVRILRDLRLCAPADLRRCRGHVRRLARDLPTFDSVWIDALLHRRALTPFQAAALESDDPERLRVGPCVLADRLGGGRFSTTYLARRIEGNERCVVKVFSLPADLVASRRRALEIVSDRLRGFESAGVSGPSHVFVDAGRLVCLSRPVDGPHLGELLVRRGRFPATVVRDIAGQLIESLASLESRGVVHGDVCLRNVRLTSAGQAVLTDGGVLPAVFPELTIHAGLAPDRYDGAAPERIGTGNSPNGTSDVYALGCLLWQLLAGRPPHATCDPLGKLAAHQTKPIGDVREWAPDTPAFLAEAIGVFTRRDPAARPASFRDLRARWGPPSSGHRRRLAAFRRQFGMPAPHVPMVGQSSRAGVRATIATFLLLASGLSAFLSQEGGKATLLSMPGETKRWLARTFQPGTESSSGATSVGTKPLPLPAPDARGVIELPHAGPWEPGQVAAAATLTIKGDPRRPAVIVIGDTPWNLSAERVRLENLIIRRDTAPVADADMADPAGARTDTGSVGHDALIEVESNRFEMRTCRLESTVASPWHDAPHRESAAGGSDAGSVGHEPDGHGFTMRSVPRAGVRWRALESRGRREPAVLISDTTFRVSGPALRLASAPGVLQVRNVLALGPAPFAEVETAHRAAKRLRLDLARLTVRGGASLLRLPVEAGRSCGQIAVEATDCVFSLSGDGAALVQFDGTDAPEGWAETVRFEGEGSLLAGGVEVVGLWRRGRATALDASSVEIEGLTSGAFEFQGDAAEGAEGDWPRRCVVRNWSAPRRGSTPPGIDPTRFVSDE